MQVLKIGTYPRRVRTKPQVLPDDALFFFLLYKTSTSLFGQNSRVDYLWLKKNVLAPRQSLVHYTIPRKRQADWPLK